MGVMTPGKIHPSHDCLYVSYGGYEYSYKHNYEILVSRGPSEWLSETKGKYFLWYGIFHKKQKFWFPKLSILNHHILQPKNFPLYLGHINFKESN